MKKILIVLAGVLVVMEIISFRASRGRNEEELVPKNEKSAVDLPVSNKESADVVIKSIDEAPVLLPEEDEEVVYPLITTEVKNGRTERTIHIGVRKYAWDPGELRVKEGELVRLIIHNADVMHGIAIPGLDVNVDIPPEGAIVEFVATKKGQEEFFCSVYCGEGHMEMRGKIIIE